MSESGEMIIGTGDQLLQATTRRRFLGLLGVAGSIVFLPSLFAACSDGGITDPMTDPANYTLDLTSDTGILNYAYALEQLAAAFYTAALTSAAFAQLSASEQEVITDLQKHEVIHREFLKAVLGTSAIPTIAFDAITIASLVSDRATLLRRAQLLEDTGVAAYNGAAKYLTQPANLLILAKIVSVEARHAAAIRDIRDAGSGRLFAGDDVVRVAGLDVKSEPSTVIKSESSTGIATVGTLNVLVSPVSIGSNPTVAAATPDFDAPLPGA
jgi:rubrerythrin